MRYPKEANRYSPKHILRLIESRARLLSASVDLIRAGKIMEGIACIQKRENLQAHIDYMEIINNSVQY